MADPDTVPFLLFILEPQTEGEGKWGLDQGVEVF